MAGAPSRVRPHFFLEQFTFSPICSDNASMGDEYDPIERELTLQRFQRLITEILQGGTRRTVFQPWEVEILVDIDSCQLNSRRKAATLRQYLRAVRKQLEAGPGPPLKLSEFLQSRRTRRPSI